MKTELLQNISNYLEKQENKTYPKDSFWASETETDPFELFHRWKGTPRTNKPNAQSIMAMKVGKLVEEAWANMLFKIGLGSDQQRHVEMTRAKVKVSGYIDQVLYEDRQEVPLEIKSFYGPFQEKELMENRPRPAYLKQLAVYCDGMNVDLGYLVCINRGSGKVYQYALYRAGPETFQCLDITINLGEVYDRWAHLYFNHIVPNIEPRADMKYKIPVKDIDWSKVSKSDMQKARKNEKVIGDWMAVYSGYLDLLMEREGTQRGYTVEELKEITKATEPYLITTRRRK